MPDIIGSTENVDVVFAAAANTASYMSFVEVRDHSRKVNRQYIQEIMGKRKSIGIDSCTIASTKGFTKDSVRLAQHEGIRLRLLNPESPDAIPFFKGSSLPFRMHQRVLARCVLFIDRKGQKKCRIIEASDLDRVSVLAPTEKPDDYLARPLSRLADLECFTLPCFANGDNIKTESAFYAGIPQDGLFHRAEPIVISYDLPKWYDIVNGELVPIRKIAFCILASAFYVEAPIHQWYKYVDVPSKDVIARSILARFRHNEVLYNLTLTAYVAEQSAGMQHLRSSIFFGEVPNKTSSSKSTA